MPKSWKVDKGMSRNNEVNQDLKIVVIVIVTFRKSPSPLDLIFHLPTFTDNTDMLQEKKHKVKMRT